MYFNNSNFYLPDKGIQCKEKATGIPAMPVGKCPQFCCDLRCYKILHFFKESKFCQMFAGRKVKANPSTEGRQNNQAIIAIITYTYFNFILYFYTYYYQKSIILI